jgi:hypothetical protein
MIGTPSLTEEGWGFLSPFSTEGSNAMTEDLLDYWVRLLKPFFPMNAWIVTRYAKDDHIIEIDWNLDNEPGRPNRRSRKIQITISNGAIEDYLDKDKKEREVFECSLTKLIQERFISPDKEVQAGTSSSADRLFIAKDTLNA